MRINKYLARYAGVSRREADRLIKAGEVTVDGVTATLGMTVDSRLPEVYVRDKRILPYQTRHYYAVYKPVGYISSTVKQGESDRLVTELSCLDGRFRLFPMGRLDKDSEGLILLTDDGELMDNVLRSRNGHEKEYEVELTGVVPDDVIGDIAAGGIDIGERRPTKPCVVERITEHRLKVVLTEGMNRQIRRVFDRYGLEVKRLCRVRFMNITLDGLNPGEGRELTSKEISDMRRMCGL